MGKTIKSNVQKLLHTMISKFKQKQEEKEVVLQEKKQCLDAMSDLLDNLEDIQGICEMKNIVMDNASYHTVQQNKVPTTQTRKAEIQEWLDSNGINCEDYLTRAELLCLVNKHKPEPLYIADELLKQYGHDLFVNLSIGFLVLEFILLYINLFFKFLRNLILIYLPDSNHHQPVLD